MDRYRSYPSQRPRPVRERSSYYDSEHPSSPYDHGYPSARHGGRRSSVIPIPMSHPATVHYDPFSGSSHRRPTISRQRSGGYGSGYVCGTGEYIREYDPVMDRPQRDPYGMGRRRRAYDIDELDDD